MRFNSFLVQNTFLRHSIVMLLLVAVVGSMFSPLFSSVTYAATGTTNPSNHTGIDDFGCSVSNATGANGGRGFALCMSQIVYAIGPGLASYVAYVGAYFFGFMVQFSLNSTSYALTFLADGWKIVRDVANMAFIFILIWIALTIMYNAQTHDTMKMLAGVIVVALLVNFSFFVTRVVIDAGNIFAVQFYNAVDTKGQLLEGTQIKDLSAAIMNAVGLQSLFSANAFDSATRAAGNSVLGGFIVLSFIYISIAAMLWVLFFAFVQVGIKFLMRVVGLWFVLIASPAAFVAGAVKGTREYFRQWLKLLFGFAFYPAVFLFIFYILVIFINGMLGGSIGASGAQTSLLNQIFNSAASTPNATGSAGPNAGVGSAIASVFIRMGLVVAMLYVGLKAADWIISTGTDAARNATGWITGKALGTAAFAGRNTIGAAGSALARNASFRNAAANSRVANALWRGTASLGRSTFDARNSRNVSRTLGVLGGSVDKKGVTRMSVGTGSTANYNTDFEARVSRQQARAAALQPTGHEIARAQHRAIQQIESRQPGFAQQLANAENEYRQAHTERQEVGDAASQARFRTARAAFATLSRQVSTEAGAIAGTGNAGAYATLISTRGHVGPEDIEAAFRIRGNQNDNDRIRAALQSLGYTPQAPTPAPQPNNPGGGNNPPAPAAGNPGGNNPPPPPPTPAPAPAVPPAPVHPVGGGNNPPHNPGGNPGGGPAQAHNMQMQRHTTSESKEVLSQLRKINSSIKEGLGSLREETAHLQYTAQKNLQMQKEQKEKERPPSTQPENNQVTKRPRTEEPPTP